jgi:hypothetical protein
MDCDGAYSGGSAMRNATTSCKIRLWQRFASPEFPAEWDGRLGGGKLSQRFWEYFEGLQMLDLSSESVVLDVGGGSPEIGSGFFARLIAPSVGRVHIVDPNAVADLEYPNVLVHQQLGDRTILRDIFEQYPDIDRVVSLSVFEHISPPVRSEIIAAINDYFRGNVFVTTFEYHSKNVYFQEQLNTRSASYLFTPLTKFYLEKIVQSPVWAENAFGEAPDLAKEVLRRLRVTVSQHSQVVVPLWYPIALKFVRI